MSFLKCGKPNRARRQGRRALSPPERDVGEPKLRELRYARLVPGAVLLLVERLAVEGARGSDHAGQDGQSEKSGQKGFHDRSPRLCRSVCCESLLLACAIWCLLHLREDAITHL